MRDLASPLDGFLSPFGAVRGRVFSPLSLFASSEEGAWYDPSDLSTLYQDSIGTTQVTAAGQPVGLVLDKSQGLTLGAELVVDGWTLGAGWAQSGNVFTATDVASNVDAYISPVVIAEGKFAKVEISWDATVTTTNWRFYLQQLSPLLDIATTAGVAGSKSAILLQSAIVLSRTAIRPLSGPASAQFTISIRELPGNHLTQATAAARPVYQTSPDRLDHDAIDDVMNVTLPDLGTDATVASVAGGTVTYLEAQTISGSYAAPTSDWAGLVIIDRALTADEKAALEGIWT